jgi:membrane-bound metal-dependent hydrolase YbcI (DUF457 family)
MMYYDHAMIGATLALAAGAHRRHGPAIVVMATLAGALPDWDALSGRFGPDAYRAVHRVWGHNLLAATLASGLFGGAAYLVVLSVRVRRAGRAALTRVIQAGPDHPDPQATPSVHGLAVWVTLGVLAALTHVLADLFYSGVRTSPDWPVALLWPFSRRGWALPLVPWSDWTATLLLTGEMLLVCLRPRYARLLAWLTLLTLVGYIGARGLAAHLVG